MQTAITTRKWQPTNGRAARIVAQCGKRKAVRRWDAFASEAENHLRAATHLAVTMRIYQPTFATGIQKAGVFVHVIA